MRENRAHLAIHIARILDVSSKVNVLFAGAGSVHDEPYWDCTENELVNSFLVDPLSDSQSPEIERIIRFALTDQNGDANLHISRGGAASSLKTLNQLSVTDSTFYDHGLLSELMAQTSNVNVKTATVDTLQAQGVLPTLHFIKLNIEGSELDALHGARHALKDCLGIQVEVSFKTMWDGAPHFSDVDAFLRECGFEFHQILAPIHHGKKNKYIKIKQDQSVGIWPFPSNQIFQAHALYLRPDSYICDGERIRRPLDVAAKLIFVCEVYGLLEKAFYIAESLEPFVASERRSAYCEQLRDSAGKYMNRYVSTPPSYSPSSRLKSFYIKCQRFGIRSRLMQLYQEIWSYV